MKVVIVALDGLEPFLVEKFDLKNLKQLEHGRMDVSNFREHFYSKTPFTPTIWASFITGLMPEEHGVKITAKYENPWVEKLRRWSIKLGLDKIKGKSKVLRAFGLGKRSNTMSLWKVGRKYYVERGIKTIFDYASNPVAYNVPTWSWTRWTFRRNLVKAYFDRKLEGEEWINAAMSILKQDFAYTLKRPRRNGTCPCFTLNL